MNDTVQKSIEDIPFHTVDGVELVGRLYRPKISAPIGAMIEVHGGGWSSGSRLNNATICQALADEGVVVFSIDFRMPPRWRFPIALQDVNDGIRWLKANAGPLGFGSVKFGGLGTSSGAHLLLTNVLRPDDYVSGEAAVSSVSAQLDLAVACWPIADPLARYQMARAQGIEKLITAHQNFWPDEKAMELANPHLIVTRDMAVHLPPLLLLQGTADGNVEHERTDSFADVYRSRGGETKVCKYNGAPHAFITRNPNSDEAKDGLAEIVRFVKTQFSK